MMSKRDETVTGPRELPVEANGHSQGALWFNRALTLVLVLALCVPLSFSVDWLERQAIACPLRQAGLPCPSCGITRSLAALYAGDLEASRAFHPAGSWLVAGLVVELCARPLVARLARRYGLRATWLDLAQLCVGAVLAGLVVARGQWP